MTFTFTYRLDIEEYVRVMRRVLLGTRNFTLNLLLGAGMATYGLWGLFTSSGDTFLPILALMGFMIGGIAVYSLYVLPGIRFKQNFQNREDVTLTLDQDGVRAVASLVDTRVKWAIYKDFAVMAGCFVLFYKGSGQTIIPLRALDGVVTEEALREFLADHLPERKK